MKEKCVIVLDVGKTLSKLSLWTPQGTVVRRATRTNMRRSHGGISMLDVDGISRWVVETLSQFSQAASIDAIIPVAHGAGLAAVRNDQLVSAPLDYEAEVPAAIAEAYRQQRDSFRVTGSPWLGGGLNAGLQLYWTEQLAPGLLEGATLMPWAQYWAWFLSGIAASEVTSLGCHTDLWSPSEGTYSPMARRHGWADKFAPVRFAGDVIGTIRPELAARCGLAPGVKVYCGLHDSNAALIAARAYSEIAGQETTILSTGTWFVAMRTPDGPFEVSGLAPDRDCLVNVDAWGRNLPSARFMGGREIEKLIGLDTRRVDIKPDQPLLLRSVAEVVTGGAMLLPTFAPGFGPFPDSYGRWLNEPQDWYSRRATACLYAALVSDVCLGLIGAGKKILVEGRFAEAEVIVRALASLRPDDRIYTCHIHNDVSFGALRLIIPDLRPEGHLVPVDPLTTDLSDYRRDWAAHTERTRQLI